MSKIKVDQTLEIFPGNSAYPQAVRGGDSVTGIVKEIHDSQTHGDGVLSVFVPAWFKTVLAYPKSDVEGKITDLINKKSKADEAEKSKIDNSIALLENYNLYEDLA